MYRNPSTIAKKVTEDIISIIEESNELPWRKPWVTNPPMNGYRKTSYKGINVWLLLGTKLKKKYVSNRWYTMWQIKEMDCHLQRGSKGAFVVWHKPYVKEEDGVEVTKFSFGGHYVFNADCIDGIKTEKTKEVFDNSIIKSAESIVSGYEIEIEYGHDFAAYSPTLDKISMPELNKFFDSDSFYSTLFHEMIHSTGHKHRLNRELKNSFGDEKYSKEELVAEIGASILSEYAGIKMKLEESADYIKNWIKRFKDDSRLIMSASSHSEKAVRLILEGK